MKILTPSIQSVLIPFYSALYLLGAIFFLTGCQSSTIKATEFWARIVPAGQGVGAVYGVIKNPTHIDAVMIGATSPLADRIELHTHGVDDAGIMRMRRVPEIIINAADTMILKPGSLHIMLFDLAKDIEVGQSYPMTLIFKDGTEIKTNVIVKPLSYAPNK